MKLLPHALRALFPIPKITPELSRLSEPRTVPAFFAVI